MNVIYDQKDATRAARIRQREKEFAEQRERKRQIEEKRAEFNKSIREVGGKLTLFDLKRLNSVYKKDYVKMVTEEDEKMKEHLSNVGNKNLDDQTELQEVIWGIQDTHDVWDTTVDDINQTL